MTLYRELYPYNLGLYELLSATLHTLIIDDWGIRKTVSNDKELQPSPTFEIINDQDGAEQLTDSETPKIMGRVTKLPKKRLWPHCHKYWKFLKYRIIRPLVWLRDHWQHRIISHANAWTYHYPVPTWNDSERKQWEAICPMITDYTRTETPQWFVLSSIKLIPNWEPSVVSHLTTLKIVHNNKK